MNIEGKHSVLEALKQNRPIKKIYIAAEGKPDAKLKEIEQLAEQRGIRVTKLMKKELDDKSDLKKHQGVIATASEYRYFDLEELVQDAKASGTAMCFMILDEIEDPHNLGAIVRSAKAAGVTGIVIPKNRSASVNATVEKVSAGHVSSMKIARVTNLVQAIKYLKKSGLWIYALDMDGEDLYRTRFDGDVAFVIGNEGKGISRLVKESCDFVVRIPMESGVESLNASVAASLLMYEVKRQRDIQ